MVLEVLAEEGLVGEIEAVGNLLDAHRRVAQHVLRLENHVVVNPVDGRMAGRLADERGEVLGREVELRGIEADAPLAHVVLAEQRHEALEVLLAAAARRVRQLAHLLQMTRNEAAHLVDEHPNRRTDNLRRIEVSRLGNPLVRYLGDAARYTLPLARLELQQRIALQLEKEVRKELDVDIDAADELLLAGRHVNLGVGGRFDVENRTREMNEEGVLAQLVAGQVREERNRTFGTEDHGKGVDTHRIAEEVHRNLVPRIHARRNQATIVIEVTGPSPAHLEQRLKREAADFLFVHCYLPFSGKYKNFDGNFSPKGTKSNLSTNYNNAKNFPIRRQRGNFAAGNRRKQTIR